MPLNDATLLTMGQQLASLCPYMSLHSADPGPDGLNEVGGLARRSCAFNVDTDGDLTLASTVSFTGGPANGTVTHVGLWSAATGGSFRGGFALSGDNAFNAAGEYDVLELTINGTSS